MATAIELLKEFKTKRDALNKEIKDNGKKLFADASAEIFEEHPILVSFSWNQYSPYFNDGDECVFSANTEYIKLRTSDETPIDPDEDEDDEEEDGFSEYDYEEGDYGKKTVKANLTPREAAGKEVIEFLANFDDDSLKEMFDNHVKVTVTRNGVEVEEYSHD